MVKKLDLKKKKESIQRDLQTCNDKLVLARSTGNNRAILSAERIIKKLEYELAKLKNK